MKNTVIYEVTLKSGKGYSTFKKEFNDDKHFDNWAKKIDYKLIGAVKIK